VAIDEHDLFYDNDKTKGRIKELFDSRGIQNFSVTMLRSHYRGKICKIWETLALTAVKEKACDFFVLFGDDIRLKTQGWKTSIERQFRRISEETGLPFGMACVAFRDTAFNVFPTFQNYIQQFDTFIDCIEPNGALVFAQEDPEVVKLAQKPRHRALQTSGYGPHPNKVENGITFLDTPAGWLPIKVFGHHNLQNLNGAMKICQLMGISDEQFYSAISSFEGASKRLEIVARRNQGIVFKDFAHSPSKLKATSSAVKKQFPQHRIVACMELHTFSSLNAEFLAQYAHSMDEPDVAIVYFNPHTIEHKRLHPISVEDVKKAFQREDLIVLTDASLVELILMESDWEKTHLLWMTSGNFDGLDIADLALRLPMN
jgi:UDP-N-acetylmuramate: L-alanyl-gamma-D-glutamyl-meso-diaminopimelate ligase